MRAVLSNALTSPIAWASAGKAGQWERALAIVEGMTADEGIKPDLAVYNALLARPLLFRALTATRSPHDPARSHLSCVAPTIHFP